MMREHARSGPAGRLLVVIDGPAGSGKTTLAAQLCDELSAPVVHMDDLYEGWDGVDQGVRILQEDLLAPWSRGEDAAYRPYDWHAARRRRTPVPIPAGEVLVVEGCHSARRPTDTHRPFEIWVEAPDDVRLERGIARDGESMRAQWLGFMSEERAAYVADGTRERADVVVDGYGKIVEPA
jgi:uridine kinase